ncbi:MAG: PQQ-binding-like beta-propeller repeat protein [Planctomycetota bacterium]|nr:PQQ-binding-like beta-propeller repeat protein [Planctomycetaceae bacterium]MDQ3329586.1 PQQ-binding-like beta-propeller repeat protein [Planctomycetota bacterium]
MTWADRCFSGWGVSCVSAVSAALLAVALPGFGQDLPPREAPLQPPEIIPQAPALQALRAQPGEIDAGDERPPLFVADRMSTRRLRLAEARLEKGVYDEAVDLLQTVLDSDEDSAAPIEDGSDVFRSLKGRAIELLSGLAPEGRRVYELKYGVTARGRLGEAINAGDWKGVEAVSRRYFHTAAGREATYRLAVWADDRGEPLEAALLFQRLKEDDGGSAFEPQLSLRTAAAWSKAGLDDLASEAAARYLDLTRGVLNPIAGAPAVPATPERLLSWLKGISGSLDNAADNRWPSIGGSADRLADVGPVAIAGGAEWSHQLHVATDWDDAHESARVHRLARGLDLLFEAAVAVGTKLTQPAFHPVVAGDVAVFRTLRNIQAVDVATGKLLWQTDPPHDRYFDAAMAELDVLLQLGPESSNGPQMISQLAWQNLTSGALSTDGRFVYGIEGTGRVIMQGLGRPNAVGESEFNTLFAYELAAEGRIAWAAGGPRTEDAASGVFFLGPPLPLGGRLYSIVETDGAIRLLAMDPLADAAHRVVWSQTLVEADQSLSSDPLRRISGLSPAFADGVLVCPTGAEAAVAVDLARRILLWGYQYPPDSGVAPSEHVPQIFFGARRVRMVSDDDRNRWLDAVPRTTNGAAFLTPRDSNELHCLDLKTGEVRWKHPRGTLLYLAAVRDDLAVLVGRQAIVALDATTGERVWEQPLDDMPAGRGVQSGDLYHLPLASGEIATIRLSNHQELVRSPVGSGIKPGNLIAVGGRLISQSTDAIVGFRRRDDLEAAFQTTEDAASAMLALRGADELHRGNTEAGLELLQRALRSADLPDAKRLYVHVLLEGLRANFAKYRKYERDLLAIVDDPDQKADFVRVFAAGLHSSGEHGAAFDAYLRLASDDAGEPGYSTTPDGRLVRADCLDRVRVREIYRGASPSAQAEMAEKVTSELRRAARAGDIAALEQFATIFADTSAAPIALQALAKEYAKAGDVLKLERAEMRLRQQFAEPANESHLLDPSEAYSAFEPAERAAFEVSFRAEYLPDEIKSGRPATAAEASLPMRIVGPVPSAFRGWSFEVAANAWSFVARDARGRKRWEIPFQPNRRFDGNHRGVSRAQIRFSGHLLAASAGTRVVMLDLTAQADRPAILWFGDLTDRNHDVAIERLVMINGRTMADPADGPIGFAGARLFLYQSGSAVTAVEPLTGEVLWRRSALPLNCELSGDDEFVTLQMPGGDKVLVLDAIDGRPVAQRELPKAIARFAWSGTNFVTWRTADQALELDCHDVARDARVWSRSFADSALAAPLGTDEVAILDPAAGRLAVIRILDGGITFEAKTEPDSAVNDFGALRHFDQLVVFTRRSQPAVRMPFETARTQLPIDGLAYGFDASGDGKGTRLWSTVIRRQYVNVRQPSGLPILLLAANRNPFGGEPKHHAAVLDVRTGELLIEQGRPINFQPFGTNVDLEAGSIEIVTQGARFLLTPTDDPLPKPRSDGLAELGDEAFGDATVLGQP